MSDRSLIAKDYLNIPYLKLNFTATLLEDCVLPRAKSSALRGGTGQMMIEQNCILAKPERTDEDCQSCDCREECLVQRFLYTPMDIEPIFSVDKSSMGYIFECDDYRERFREGETFRFSVTLFGKSRVYVNILLQALWSLGNTGLGKKANGGRFVLTEISNGHRQPVMVNTEYGPQIIKERLEAQTVADYVAYRKRQLAHYNEPDEIWTMKLQSDMTLKYQKQIVEELSSEAVVSNLLRRIYLFNCFNGVPMEYRILEEKATSLLPEMISQNTRKIYCKRYSTRQQRHVTLDGITGSAVFRKPCEEMQEYLLAGEILHIGKNTSMGFGRYRIEHG